MKKIINIFLALVLSFLVVSCGDKNETKKSSVDETTNQLTVYIWASNTTEFFTPTEIESIKNSFSTKYPDIEVFYKIIQNVTKDEFGEKVNNANDADVILAGSNMDSTTGCNIALKTSSDTSKTMIHSSWTAMDARYIGIADICESTHLQNALLFKEMLLNEIPAIYKYQNVLFLGNSYTYYNSIATMFKGVCESIGMSITVEEIFKGGCSLDQFINDTEEHQTLISKLSTTKYNYIFIQDQSVRPIHFPDGFKASVNNLTDLIHTYNPDAKVVLFCTWARNEGNDFYTENPGYTYKQMAREIIEEYVEASKDRNLIVSYAGFGFFLSHESNNGITIYQNDNSHPTPSGTYLAALIHAGTIFGINPIDIPYVPQYTVVMGGNNKKMPTSDECVELRKIASQVVLSFDLSLLND